MSHLPSPSLSAGPRIHGKADQPLVWLEAAVDDLRDAVDHESQTRREENRKMGDWAKRGRAHQRLVNNSVIDVLADQQEQLDWLHYRGPEASKSL